MIIFQYKKEIYDDSQSVLRPVADVYLKGAGGIWVKFHPYIDSGADVTLIPKSLGELLGWKEDNLYIKYLGGIRGRIPIVYKRVQMRIGNVIFPVKLAWAQIENIPPLLGRMGVFDQFEVTFRQKKGQIEFEEI